MSQMKLRLSVNFAKSIQNATEHFTNHLKTLWWIEGTKTNDSESHKIETEWGDRGHCAIVVCFQMSCKSQKDFPAFARCLF